MIRNIHKFTNIPSISTSLSRYNPSIRQQFICRNFSILKEILSASPKNEVAYVNHPYPINGIPIEQSNLDQDIFAVIELNGRQYKVTKDDNIVSNRLEGLDIGQEVTADQVLLVASRKSTILGVPLVSDAKVLLEVEEVTKDKKLIIFKKRRRKNSQSKNGYRRHVTILRVKDIVIANRDKQRL